MQAAPLVPTTPAPSHAGLPFLQCPAPANCDAAQADICDGCLTCKNGYSRNAANGCEECTNNPNCATFDANACTCAACNTGFDGLACNPVSWGL